MPSNDKRSFTQVSKKHGLLAAVGVAASAAAIAAPVLETIVLPQAADRLGKALGKRVRSGVGWAYEAARNALASPDAGERVATAAAKLSTLGMPLTWYGYSAASDPTLPYDLSFWRAGVSVVGSALGAWFAHRRSVLALPVLAAADVATVGLGAMNKYMTGTYVTRTWEESSWREKLFNGGMPLAHGALIAAQGISLLGSGLAARRAGLGLQTSYAPLVQAPWYPLVRKLSLYYMVFSILGHWGEILFCLGIKHGIFMGGYDRSNAMLWDQWLFPFPAEGTAAVLIALFLYPIKEILVKLHEEHVAAGRLPVILATPLAFGLSFVLNQIVCTSIDYLTGMVANRDFELWDYRDMPFNFQGQVCLQNSLFYTVVATAAVWGLFPPMENAIANASDTALDGTLVGLGSFFVFLELLYHVVPADVQQGVEALRQLAREFKDRYEETLAEQQLEQLGASLIAGTGDDAADDEPAGTPVDA